MATSMVTVVATDFNNIRLNAARLNVYQAGTTTPVTIYQDAALSTPATNPAITDSSGRLTVWLDSNQGTQKIVLEDSGQTTQYFTQDNIVVGDNPNLVVLPAILGDQNLRTTDTPAFAGLTVNGNAAVTGVLTPGTLTVTNNATVGGTLGVTGNFSTGGDLTVTGTSNVGAINATAAQATTLVTTSDATFGGAATISGALTASNGLSVTGAIAVSGLVDGRDIAADGLTLDNLNSTLGLSALSAAEVSQLTNIGTSTISAAQWGYLGGSVAFGGSLFAATDAAAARSLIGVSLAGSPVASQAEAEAGTDNEVLMTPLRARDAHTSLLASQAEAEAGTDNTKTMTPLQARNAHTSLLASQAEAEAGTDNTKTMTPLRSKQAFTAHYDALPAGYVTPDGNDNAALLAAAAVSKNIQLDPSVVYRFDNLVLPGGIVLNGNGAVIKRVTGSYNPALVISGYGNTLYELDFDGELNWLETTVASAATANGTNKDIAVSDATGFAVGMRCFYESAWRGRIETNEIASINSNTITFRRPIRGNISAGVKFTGSHALVKFSGTGLRYTAVWGLKARNALVGVQLGEYSVDSGNAFPKLHGVHALNCLGAGIVQNSNVAGENIIDWVTQGGYTQTIDHGVWNGSATLTMPYTHSARPSRWGSEPSARVFVDSTTQDGSSLVQLSSANYSVNETTGVVTISSGASAGDYIRLTNYEYSAYGFVGDNYETAGADEIGRMVGGLTIASNIGIYMQGCELAHMIGTQTDTSSYAGIYLENSSKIVFNGESLFTPFPVVLEDCSKVKFVDITTDIAGNSVEQTPTANKVDFLGIGTNTDIVINKATWVSYSGGYSQSNLDFRDDVFVSDVGFGVTAGDRFTPEALLHLRQRVGAYSGIQLEGIPGGSSAIPFLFRRPRGTYDALVRNNANDELGDFRFQGHDGGAYRTVAGIRSRIVGTPSSGNISGALYFYTRTGTNFERFVWVMQDSGNLVPAADNTYDLGSPSLRTRDIYANDLDVNGDINIAATAGMKVGTAASQKLGFFGAAPVAQQSGTGELGGFGAGSATNAVYLESTFTGNVGSTAYGINDIVKALKNLGLLQL